MSLFFSVLENRLWWATVIPRCPYGTRIVAKWNHQWSTRSELLTARQILEEKKTMRHHGTLFCSIYFTLLFFCFLKLTYFKKTTQFFRNLPLLFWHHNVILSKQNGKFFSNFVAFSQYLNFTNDVVKLSKPEFSFAYLGNNLKGKTGEIKDDQVTFTTYLCNARTSLGMFHLPDISDVLAQKRFLLFTNA